MFFLAGSVWTPLKEMDGAEKQVSSQKHHFKSFLLSFYKHTTIGQWKDKHKINNLSIHSYCKILHLVAYMKY